MSSPASFASSAVQHSSYILEKKMGRVNALKSPLRVAVLISGGGTTLKNLLEKIGVGQLDAEIRLVISSNPNARGLQFAREAGIRAAVYELKCFADEAEFSREIFDDCRSADVEIVVMGGFL